MHAAGSFPVKSVPEYVEWSEDLDEGSYDAIYEEVLVLSEIGPKLGRPRVDTLKGSKYKKLKELRIQYKGHVYRVFFAFDSKREAWLLLGGDKRGDDRFYKEMVPIAEKLYKKYIN